ncbi:hypothetical protein B8V81_2406 [Paenibacillus pasadenensis]|uniref:Copper amine oxidase-like N-terminal domain-containing protein n=2 Tax=Paenibacillus TaxID=44249 RepID=A0A2N5N0X8_9BACL|nr:hypothetical protein B8V81_2406 [Paenibacillus pasadenensis]
MVQAFAKKGKPVKAFDSTPYSFFYGLSLTFSNKGDASIFGSTGGLYLESGSTFLQLDDISVSKDYSSLFVRNEEIAEIPATARFGEKIRLKGHDPLLFSPELFVYWTPNAETYSSSSDSSGYPYDHSLLIGTGTQQFGYYDFSITLPAYGKAKDGTMKFLESKGSLSLYVAYGGNGSRTLGEMSLLPAAEPFLSVDGKPALDAALRPILREGRALLPLRSIAKLAGKSVVWDKASWSALIRSEPPAPRKGAYSFPQLWIDGKLAAPELQPILRDGLTYVPIRALTAAFGISVSWNAASRSVDIELP